MTDNRPPDPYQFLTQVPSFEVSSDDLTDGGTLPNAQVFDDWGMTGENRSPQLRWSGFPAETQSFAVTCYDPDAPTASGFWHWSLFDLPASVTELTSGVGAIDGSGIPTGAKQARNDFGTNGYGGAAPPAGHGPHRYFFVVHALGVDTLGVDETASPAVVGFLCNANALARARLVVTFELP
ncbi:MAG: YbhB/YbcL family Raf kinase inhibitor-like protein [Sporichthyaceae bacterium]|nr:YbhB/YbcL family Raf kinase inhibitor-like protein [Sporichthyaceae bacterium]